MGWKPTGLNISAANFRRILAESEIDWSIFSYIYLSVMGVPVLYSADAPDDCVQISYD